MPTSSLGYLFGPTWTVLHFSEPSASAKKWISMWWPIIRMHPVPSKFTKNKPTTSEDIISCFVDKPTCHRFWDYVIVWSLRWVLIFLTLGNLPGTAKQLMERQPLSLGQLGRWCLVSKCWWWRVQQQRPVKTKKTNISNQLWTVAILELTWWLQRKTARQVMLSMDPEGNKNCTENTPGFFVESINRYQLYWSLLTFMDVFFLLESLSKTTIENGSHFDLSPSGRFVDFLAPASRVFNYTKFDRPLGVLDLVVLCETLVFVDVHWIPWIHI